MVYKSVDDVESTTAQYRSLDNQVRLIHVSVHSRIQGKLVSDVESEAYPVMSAAKRFSVLKGKNRDDDVLFFTFIVLLFGYIVFSSDGMLRLLYLGGVICQRQ
jgi:hypothetical protein